MEMRDFRKSGVALVAFSLLLLTCGLPTFAVMGTFDGKTFSGEV